MDRDWSFAVVTACQRFVCQAMMSGSLDDAVCSAHALRESIPSPPDQLASSFLRSTLLEMALRWGRERHRRLAGRCRCQPCVVTALVDAPDFWNGACAAKSPGEADAFVSCIGAIAQELKATHEASLAERAAEMISAETGRISIDSTARSLGAHPATLRRAFQREFGMTAREFLTRLRVARAEALLSAERGAKVEPIAMAVGWRTKRGLYRAFRQLRGRTPGGGRTNIA